MGPKERGVRGGDKVNSRAFLASKSPLERPWQQSLPALPLPATGQRGSLTLHCEHGLGADLSCAVPGFTGVSARVLREHFLDTKAVLSASLFKVEVL